LYHESRATRQTLQRAGVSSAMVQICTHIHIHSFPHTCAHTHALTHIHICTRAHTHSHPHAHIRTLTTYTENMKRERDKAETHTPRKTTNRPGQTIKIVLAGITITDDSSIQHHRKIYFGNTNILLEKGLRVFCDSRKALQPIP